MRVDKLTILLAPGKRWGDTCRLATRLDSRLVPLDVARLLTPLTPAGLPATSSSSSPASTTEPSALALPTPSASVPALLPVSLSLSPISAWASSSRACSSASELTRRRPVDEPVRFQLGNAQPAVGECCADSSARWDRLVMPRPCARRSAEGEGPPIGVDGTEWWGVWRAEWNTSWSSSGALVGSGSGRLAREVLIGVSGLEGNGKRGEAGSDGVGEG